jgi:hypothetical protein
MQSLLLMILYHRLIKQLDTFNKFVDTYYVNINFVESYGIISALSNNRNQFIMGEAIKLDRICNKIVLNVKAERKSFKYFIHMIYSKNSTRA